jgi:hypothetical protein
LPHVNPHSTSCYHPCHGPKMKKKMLVWIWLVNGPPPYPNTCNFEPTKVERSHSLYFDTWLLLAFKWIFSTNNELKYMGYYNSIINHNVFSDLCLGL